jgi:hypothetical protein
MACPFQDVFYHFSSPGHPHLFLISKFSVRQFVQFVSYLSRRDLCIMRANRLKDMLQTLSHTQNDVCVSYG